MIDRILAIYIWAWPIVLLGLAALLFGCWLETRKR